MAFSMRSIQASLNAGGFSVNEVNAMTDSRPVVLQNFLQGTFTSTSSVTLTPIGVGTQAAIAAGSQLYVELQESDTITEQGCWEIEGRLFLTGALVGIGVKVNLLAGDGLQILNTGFSQFEIDLKNTGASDIAAYGFASATATNTASVTAVVSTVFFHGIVQVTGYGGLYVQLAQNVSTGTAVTVGAGSFIKATSQCQFEH